jgi:hypothetical protein
MKLKLEHIKGVSTEHVGGNMTVDFVWLKGGRVLGINDECVCLYKDMDQFWEARSDTTCLDLCEVTPGPPMSAADKNHMDAILEDLERGAIKVTDELDHLSGLLGDKKEDT